LRRTQPEAAMMPGEIRYKYTSHRMRSKTPRNMSGKGSKEPFEIRVAKLSQALESLKVAE